MQMQETSSALLAQLQCLGSISWLLCVTTTRSNPDNHHGIEQTTKALRSNPFLAHQLRKAPIQGVGISVRGGCQVGGVPVVCWQALGIGNGRPHEAPARNPCTHPHRPSPERVPMQASTRAAGKFPMRHHAKGHKWPPTVWDVAAHVSHSPATRALTRTSHSGEGTDAGKRTGRGQTTHAVPLKRPAPTVRQSSCRARC
jgi:hypothetical protein